MQVSIDFTVPEGELGTHLPVSVLPKWPPLYRLDFSSADGTPLPILTSEQNGLADHALLVAFAEKTGAPALGQADFSKAIRSLARGPETDLFKPFVTFLDGLGDLSDPRVARLAEVGAMLTATTLLWYPISEPPGTRTICKLDYLIRATEEIRWWERLARALSLYQPPEYITLWHAGADANFHADVEVPKPLVIREAEPTYLSFADPEDAYSDYEAPKKGTGEGNRPDQFVDITGHKAHVYVSGRRPLAVELAVRFAPARGGMVSSAFVAAALISALVTLIFAWRDWVREPEKIDATVAVLILAPALIGYLVVRPSDHPVARRHLVGMQVLSVVAAVIPLAMAVLLLRYEGDPSCLSEAWRWPVYGSWALAALLLLGLLRAGSGRLWPRKQTSEH